ncbi:hypothetical protein [Nocardiopsis potens]|uniref:hypothetical protein n=1 Tax=Nocardiopsis potens TaxID=1246458 RepID=UPI000345C418|nr:hypothetical protein [Nocardiopsis potens]
MTTGTYEFQTEFARRYHGRGKSEGEAEALPAVLEARGVGITERHREPVSSCTDAERLREWVVRAATATRAEQVFG